MSSKPKLVTHFQFPANLVSQLMRVHFRPCLPTVWTAAGVLVSHSKTQYLFQQYGFHPGANEKPVIAYEIIFFKKKTLVRTYSQAFTLVSPLADFLDFVPHSQ
jgi:hypothetical protein